MDRHGITAVVGETRILETLKIMRKTNCESDEVLRRRVYRCRKRIKTLARDAGDPEPSLDAVIENSPWHGYRLNPDRVRLVRNCPRTQSEINVRLSPNSDPIADTRGRQLSAKRRPAQVQQTECLFDDLVGKLLQLERHVETERLGNL